MHQGAKAKQILDHQPLNVVEKKSCFYSCVNCAPFDWSVISKKVKNIFSYNLSTSIHKKWGHFTKGWVQNQNSCKFNILCTKLEMCPHPNQPDPCIYFKPAVKKIRPGYFLTWHEEIFFDPRGKNWNFLDFLGKFS